LDGTSRETLRCYGFKEIRYGPSDVQTKVEFLEQMYPGCGVIFNTREPADVVSSEFQVGKDPSYFARLNDTHVPRTIENCMSGRRVLRGCPPDAG
jgi:hypothetical protein